MEKYMDIPPNVMIYKQHWDFYIKMPGLLQKLKLEQPVQHHLLQHFRQNVWLLRIRMWPIMIRLVQILQQKHVNMKRHVPVTRLQTSSGVSINDVSSVAHIEGAD